MTRPIYGVPLSTKINDYKHFKTKAKYMILENVRHLQNVNTITWVCHERGTERIY